tara:strand:- start:486 stop:659 length:174 start_codon:yes stop_codon:yes gene_type:complete
MPKEKASQTTSQMKTMYKQSLNPVEILYNQPFSKERKGDPLIMTKTVLMMKGRGGSI